MANATHDDGSPETRPSPWHEGERALHERIGLADKMERAGRHSLRDAMADQHRFFFAQLPFLLAGSVDDQAGPGPRCWPGCRVLPAARIRAGWTSMCCLFLATPCWRF
jgi:predicted pyridoxine 5'-phosphate oxidase superfamily flavin-nucleotide-binding protein